MPLSGMIEMLNMQINTWFGGVGVGWMNYFTFIIIAVFISGLMVGRTPEFLRQKNRSSRNENRYDSLPCYTLFVILVEPH